MLICGGLVLLCWESPCGRRSGHPLAASTDDGAVKMLRRGVNACPARLLWRRSSTSRLSLSSPLLLSVAERRRPVLTLDLIPRAARPDPPSPASELHEPLWKQMGCSLVPNSPRPRAVASTSTPDRCPPFPSPRLCRSPSKGGPLLNRGGIGDVGRAILGLRCCSRTGSR